MENIIEELSKKLSLANLELKDENLLALKKYLDLLYDANDFLRKRIIGTSFEDGAFFIGEHKNGLKHGVGVYFYPHRRYFYTNKADSLKYNKITYNHFNIALVSI